MERMERSDHVNREMPDLSFSSTQGGEWTDRQGDGCSYVFLMGAMSYAVPVRMTDRPFPSECHALYLFLKPVPSAFFGLLMQLLVPEKWLQPILPLEPCPKSGELAINSGRVLEPAERHMAYIVYHMPGFHKCCSYSNVAMSSAAMSLSIPQEP
jgi:hypothetical protein